MVRLNDTNIKMHRNGFIGLLKAINRAWLAREIIAQNVQKNTFLFTLRSFFTSRLFGKVKKKQLENHPFGLLTRFDEAKTIISFIGPFFQSNEAN